MFEDKYFVWMKLKDDNGKVYVEAYECMSLSDFEVLYGNISDDIIEIKLKKVE